jgi:uncharacterized membrane protein
METSISLPEKLSHLLESSRDYLETKVELEVLKGADKIAQGMSVFASLLAAMAMGMLVLLLVCLGFAVWINETMQSGYAGYFIVSGAVLIVLLLVFFLGRKQIKKAVINNILNSIDND